MQKGSFIDLSGTKFNVIWGKLINQPLRLMDGNVINSVGADELRLQFH